jgi:hypothetical protein
MTSAENYGPQFDDIIGKNYAPGEAARAAFNQEHDTKEYNLSLMPHLVKKDIEGSYIKVRDGGFSHIWDGGSHIHHMMSGSDGLLERFGSTPVSPGPMTENKLHEHIAAFHDRVRKLAEED